jgi:hypothetical protein
MASDDQRTAPTTKRKRGRPPLPKPDDRSWAERELSRLEREGPPGAAAEFGALVRARKVWRRDKPWEVYVQRHRGATYLGTFIERGEPAQPDTVEAESTAYERARMLCAVAADTWARPRVERSMRESVALARKRCARVDVQEQFKFSKLDRERWLDVVIVSVATGISVETLLNVLAPPASE